MIPIPPCKVFTSVCDEWALIIIHVSPIVDVLASKYIPSFPNLEWGGVTPCSHHSGEDHQQCETLATKIMGANYVIKAVLPRWNIFTRCDVGIRMPCHCCYCYHSTWQKSPNPFTFSVIAGITYWVLISPELCELSNSSIWTNSSTYLIFVCAFILLEVGKYLALVKMGKRVMAKSCITWGKVCGNSGLHRILLATISSLESYHILVKIREAFASQALVHCFSAGYCLLQKYIYEVVSLMVLSSSGSTFKISGRIFEW